MLPRSLEQTVHYLFTTVAEGSVVYSSAHHTQVPSFCVFIHTFFDVYNVHIIHVAVQQLCMRKCNMSAFHHSLL